MYSLHFAGGRIDHAHHYNNPYRALEETLLLDKVVYAVLSLVELSETLVVVTSDHSHVVTFGGLATPRGNSILGKLRILSAFSSTIPFQKFVTNTDTGL